MRKVIAMPLMLLIASFMVWSSVSQARVDELLKIASAGTVAETIERLQASALAAGFSIVARVDHAKAAAGAGFTLRPTEVLVFGNPKGGSPLMLCDQRAGIDLPLRALAWQDEGGQVWLGMMDPRVLKVRFSLPAPCDAPIEAMGDAVHRFLEAASHP